MCKRGTSDRARCTDPVNGADNVARSTAPGRFVLKCLAFRKGLWYTHSSDERRRKGPNVSFQKCSALALVSILSLNFQPRIDAQEQPKQLKILVIRGDEPIENVKVRTTREPIIEVRDENDRPIAGAAVFFRLPANGPSGVFPVNNTQVLTVTTDAQGRAAARFVPNRVEGNTSLQVTASHSGLTASTSIPFTVSPPPAVPPLGKMAIIGAIGAATVVGIVAATRNGNNTPAASPTTITAGGTTVGGR